VFVRAAVPTGPTALWICDTDGGNLGLLAAADEPTQRLLSPVWRSDSKICYAKGRRPDSSLGAEVWEIDLDEPSPRLLFRFSEALDKRAGLVTDASPDGGHLAVIAQSGSSATTTDVYLVDAQGKLLATVWEDGPGGGTDFGAIWSPEGSRIAWRHYATSGTTDRTIRCTVGHARLGADGEWSAEVDRVGDAFILPLAWAPDGNALLCARIDDSRRRLPRATLLLFDADLQPIRKLFDVAQWWRVPPSWDGSRLADWTVLPPDAPLPVREQPPPRRHKPEAQARE
jgi:hypothetical protein